MHEFAMCESLLITLQEEYDRFLKASDRTQAPRVTAVRLVAGELHQIVEESFRLAWEALTAETAFRGARLEMKRIPVTVRCQTCAWEGVIQAPFFVCGRCGQGRVETLAGKEFYIEDMEIEDDESARV